ncbi:hypothetical protein E2562_036359 [Oryza meyeriana var. granulata]|uniref:Phytocyanin domain-containing protein n=1 Tax=Oryza meyeriana var. granulata TaxID=110450 RepID=A0A6G1FFX6_9ORYZ|nr:hypothetical protein E2562_036359 [Oryza meyeriana var. granulata]
MASSCVLARGLVTCSCFVLLHVAAMAGATQYKVGGDGGWGVPAAGAESFNTWAEKTSFQIGDQLLFVYPKEDSVLMVEPADYNACNTASYDKKFDDGSTAVTLDRAGAFFFISGVDANCRANEKLIVMVANTTAAPPPSSPSSGGGAPARQAPLGAPATTAGSANNSTTANGGAGGAGAKSGAGLTVAGGLAGSVVASIAYVVLAI